MTTPPNSSGDIVAYRVSSEEATRNVSPLPDFLAKKNIHPRDEFITFDEGPHIYTVHGELGYTSVTTFVHKHFPSFDSDRIIANILKSPRHKTDPTYKYYNQTKEEIELAWEINRNQASGAGTKMHYDIECYFNELPVENDSTEFKYFQNFCKDFVDSHDGLKPYRTEWMVYYEEYKISGSIDMIFENPDGTIQIYDWKRCKSIEYEAFGDSRAITPCIAHMPDSNYWHYSIQLNMYKMILEEKYGKKVTGLYLVCLHPDNPYKNYDRIEVPILTEEIQELLSWWQETKNNIKEYH
jgi:CRISPR/Cas system-associated exonuclease Cas4 (RecB family)